eukprot:CAMPEP_0170559120 /NCGR_PEP_ID=MMETSP0211-20121228/40287_1 /TAXON_ID=311385 /ORGANISM="Pseudokeronopsis sp., Strain OXSARD2" /LENGTH=131 /DNA_ID=CAMNT_0010871785 /DNA_START=182 /DNA_END=574 /DNA_ORIENTATION=-
MTQVFKSKRFLDLHHKKRIAGQFMQSEAHNRTFKRKDDLNTSDKPGSNNSICEIKAPPEVKNALDNSSHNQSKSSSPGRPDFKVNEGLVLKALENYKRNKNSPKGTSFFRQKRKISLNEWQPNYRKEDFFN